MLGREGLLAPGLLPSEVGCGGDDGAGRAVAGRYRVPFVTPTSGAEGRSGFW